MILSDYERMKLERSDATNGTVERIVHHLISGYNSGAVQLDNDELEVLIDWLVNNGALRNVGWQFGQITSATVRYKAHQHINLYW